MATSASDPLELSEERDDASERSEDAESESSMPQDKDREENTKPEKVEVWKDVRSGREGGRRKESEVDVCGGKVSCKKKRTS